MYLRPLTADDAAAGHALRLIRDSGSKQRHRVHIRGLYVAAAHRGKGAARMLMEHLLEFAATLDEIPMNKVLVR
ncbi:GNAT family N-acetyltransferase [Pseudoduganella sp. OTU4001]|uniref:GNAT family N-acetyltransferase n=1 Tax=Pseudoduganella sp. OTU4001 TaxID=3043854 RepID=UPI00313F2603